ncbi:MAG TPA: DUF5063 domain-containing protein [Actinomycetes bacterium]|jgi:hypothetical protein|nr:DUF5063 domain-containing protein [Actinomycetes bacterium]
MSEEGTPGTRWPVPAEDDLTGFAGEIADQVQSFLIALREIARSGQPNGAVPLLLLEVSQLLLAGGRLAAISDVVPEERFEPDPGFDPDVEDLRTALVKLLDPIDHYVEVFDPYAAEAVPETYSLSDDLAQIAVDLNHGLEHYRRSRIIEALWWWQFSYFSSWGGQASGVVRALQSVVAHDRMDREYGKEIDEEDRLLAEVVAEAAELP